MRLGLAFVGFPEGIVLGETLLEVIDRWRKLARDEAPWGSFVAGMFAALLA